MAERVDEKMLRNLDLLLDMDLIEQEPDWDMIEASESGNDTAKDFSAKDISAKDKGDAR
jgi:hypothetical protein